MRTLLHYFKPHRLVLIPILLGCMLEMFFNAQVPLSVKFIIDSGLTPHDHHAMMLVLVALAGASILVSATSLWRDYLYAGIVSKVVSALRVRMFSHMQSMSLDFYAKNGTGDLMSRFLNDLAAVEGALEEGVLRGLQPILDLLLSIIVVFTFEWRLALLGVLLCPLCALGPKLLAKRARHAAEEKHSSDSSVVSTLQESLSAPELIKAYNLQPRSEASFHRSDTRLRRAGLRLGFLTSLMERSAGLGSLLLEAIVMAVAGWFAYRGDISIGTFASFLGLFHSLSSSFMIAAQFTPTAVHGLSGLHRIEEILDEKPTVADRSDAVVLDQFKDSVELRDVTFGYTVETRNLNSVSLRFKKGEFVGFVGPSGSGKSTILSLLLRFYDPAAGAVIMDGRDIRTLTQSSLRSHVAVVFQHNILFNTSLRENIALSKPDATDEEIIGAARAAGIHDAIAAMPEGYKSLAGEKGSRLSLGQRQLVAIARALLSDPNILILDEATASLDAATEQHVTDAIERLAHDRTVVAVTHRLASVKSADRLFYLDKGTIAEQGTHAELIAAKGRYADLWRKQAGVHAAGDGTDATVDIEWLAELQLMKGVSASTIATVREWFITESFHEGRTIVEQGDPGDRFYIIARGTVEVVRVDENGNTRSLAKLTEGDHFGEMALLSGAPRNATVLAITPCVCLSLSRGRFSHLLETEPELRTHVRQVSAARAANA